MANMEALKVNEFHDSHNISLNYFDVNSSSLSDHIAFKECLISFSTSALNF